MNHKLSIFFKVSLCVLAILYIQCTKPVAPTFEFKEGVVFIDAFVTTEAGTSFARIEESAVERGRFSTEFISGATVSFINVDTGAEVALIESEGSYVPPNTFAGAPNETWQLSIVLNDGRQYHSSPETIPDTQAPIQNLRATYTTELNFDENLDDFIPGHVVTLDLDDPQEENFYYWQFRSFENLTFCADCNYRLNRQTFECEAMGREFQPPFSYACATSCWRIRTNDNIALYSDEFSNGRLIENLPVANVPLFTNENIVIELQQFSISQNAHEYYSILKDIVDNTGSFNAPPPVAFVGNVINRNDENEQVLGRFTASNTLTTSLFIERESIQDKTIETEIRRRVEPFIDALFAIPCEEQSNRTGIRPTGWID